MAANAFGFNPAVWQAYREGRLGRSSWWPNVLSGLVVAIVAIPLALGFAIASGAKPEQGLFTAIVAGVLLLLLGFFRAGDLMRYVPSTVILGFTAGIAIIIWVGQWRYFLGLQSVPAGPMMTHLDYWLHLDRWSDGPTLLLGVCGLGLSMGMASPPLR